MNRQFSRLTLSTAGGVALIGGALFGSVPAFAATISAADCQSQSGTYAVRAVAINSGDTITLFQTGADGHFEGQGSVEVYCKAKGSTTNLGEIPESQVRIAVHPANASVPDNTFTITPLNGTGQISTGNPAVIGPFTGSTDFLISAQPNLLPPGVSAADVGVQVEIVTEAWDGKLKDPVVSGFVLTPRASGDVLAQTPELDSLPLFASGALGLLGYLGLRRRARGK